MTSRTSDSEIQRRKTRRRAAGAGVCALALVGLGAAPASAHHLRITPPAAEEPVVERTVSHAWAQAHCHALSPATTHKTTQGIVVFTPQGAFACPEVENPGGKVHPHAGEQ